MTYDIEKIKDIVLNVKPLFLNRDESSEVKTKGVADFVTKTDMHVQDYMQKSLKEAYPDVQFLSEEKDNSDIDFTSAVWILDPVDGTTNLIHDFHGSCLSLALSVDRELMFGIVYIPDTDELFFAQKGKGAFLQNTASGSIKKIHVSNVDTMSDSLISIGSSPYKKHWASLNFKTYEKIFMDASDYRRIGSAAIEMSYVAAGRLEAYVEAMLNPWDYSAGMIIIEEAGGSVTTYDGKRPEIGSASSIVSSNGIMGDVLVEKYLPREEEYLSIKPF